MGQHPGATEEARTMGQHPGANVEDEGQREVRDASGTHRTYTEEDELSDEKTIYYLEL